MNNSITPTDEQLNKKPAESPQGIKPTSPVLDPNLTKKEKELIQLYVSNPKISKTDAFKQVYDTKTENKQSIYSQASQVFKKPTVESSLARYTELVESTLVNTISDWGSHEKPRQREIAIDTAKFVHDKIHGRATQRIEQQTTGITFKIDLSQQDDDEPINSSNS